MNDDALAAEVLRRDGLRLKRIAGLTIGLWLLAALVIPGFYFPYQAFIEPKLLHLERVAAERDPALTVHVLAGHMAVTSRAAAIAATGYLTVFTLTSLLAAVSTVWLVFSARRVTLRQLGEGLADISRQLKERQP